MAIIFHHHLCSAGFHPGAIALHGVDLTIVGNEAEWLCQAPGWLSICAEALVEKRNRGFDSFICQIRIKASEILWQAESLVNKCAETTGHCKKVVIGETGSAQVFLDLAAHKHELPLVVSIGHFGWSTDEHLHDFRQCIPGGLTEDRWVGWNLTGRQHLEPSRLHGSLYPVEIVVIVARQEQHGHAIFASCEIAVTGFGQRIGKKHMRHLDHDACTVTGARIGPDSTAMCEVHQPGQRLFHN